MSVLWMIYLDKYDKQKCLYLLLYFPLYFFNKNYLHECCVKFGTIKVSTEEVEKCKKINELL